MATQAKQVEAPKAPDTMRIWSAVEKTDPTHTKKVNQRGGFTAISAHYQIREATRVFGPVGVGWGYIAGDPIILDGIASVPVTIWHGTRDQSFGPIYGGAELRDSRGKPDSDALKKAETDGLTKGLSHLGFNADVFLGKFDDNKYIEQMRGEFAEAAARIDDAQRAQLMMLAEAASADMKGFCTFYKIESLPELPADRFEHAKAMLEKKIAAKSTKVDERGAA